MADSAWNRAGMNGLAAWTEIRDCDPVGDLRVWARRVYEDSYAPGPHRHVLPATALYRPGKYVCADCKQTIDIPYPLSESL